MSDTTAQDAEFDALWAKVEAKVRKEHADDPLLENHLVAATGPIPEVAWLLAFVAGSQESARVAAGESGADDLVWSPLPAAGLALVLGRDGTAYRARERRQAAALARIVDTRFRELARARSRLTHPSRG
jgi:hypothetical protein